MHGVRRGARRSAAEEQQDLERSTVLADLIRRALVVRNTTLQLPLSESFKKEYEVVGRALEANPDEYTLWAFRREVLLKTAESETLQSVDQAWRHELDLTTRALRKHPKAYPAWQHRLWLLEDEQIVNSVSCEVRRTAIEEEQRLSAFMLSKDGRNFHGWAHRMRVRDILISINPEKKNSLERDEVEFVEEKINEDFANYSAWHHRSVLLPKVHGEDNNKFIADELEYVWEAFYTEPDVQSAWFYHHWLISGAPARGKKGFVQEDLLRRELENCQTLLDLEPNARYALQTKAHIMLQLRLYAEAEETLTMLEKMVSFISSK